MLSMKHYFIAFCLVFSALTSSWSGAAVQSEVDSPPCHHAQMVSHDCCDNTMKQDACSACDGECHCDVSGSQVNVGLLQAKSASFLTGFSSLVTLSNSQLPVEPFQRKFLPPKI